MPSNLGGGQITEHPGVITLDGDPIEVTVGLATHRISLSSNGSEIGSWSTDECTIVDNGEGNYLLIAENEKLPFVPVSRDLFAEALGSAGAGIATRRQSPPRHLAQGVEAPPRPLTVVGFYLLAAITTLLGVWALWSIVV